MDLKEESNDAFVTLNISDDENFCAPNKDPEDLPELWSCTELQNDRNVEATTTLETNNTQVEAVPYLKIDENSNTKVHVPDRQDDIKEQIINIQKQLYKLANLPFIIQNAIGDIANQVSELIPDIYANGTISANVHNSNASDITAIKNIAKEQILESIIPDTMPNSLVKNCTNADDFETLNEEDQQHSNDQKKLCRILQKEEDVRNMNVKLENYIISSFTFFLSPPRSGREKTTEL